MSEDSQSGGPAALEDVRRLTRRPALGTVGRLLILHGTVVALVLGVVLVQVIRDFTAHYQSAVQAQLTAAMTGYSAAFARRPPGQNLEAFSNTYLLTHPVPPGEVVLIGLLHQPSLGSGNSLGFARIPLVRGWLRSPPARPETVQVVSGSVTYLTLASPITLRGSTHGVFVAAASLARLQAEADQVALLAALEAAVALLVALASAYLILRRVLRAVGTLTDTAMEASQGDLTRRIGYQGVDDEVGRMAATFDSMLSRISATVGAQRQLLADVAHQLRTPLTVAKGHLEVLHRSGTDDPHEVSETTALVVEELSQMSSLVDQLLLLGHSLEPDFIQPEQVDLRSFMADLGAAVTVLAERNWVLSPVPDAVVVVDQAKLRGALLNLIDNSVKATGAGDTITLSATCGSKLLLSVSDAGRGIAPELQAAVFDRFRRVGPRDQRGSGLGLALVKAVVEGHGGHVDLDSSLGHGTTVTVVLPAACLQAPTDRGSALP
ncbi:MAG TPA: HAMP domain-containing sensor histidine kinase [Candidatus Micrarchaeaceae archaeon]|nr:HAMP domain-containing sensor histidine kinase [Candidatus Micrarchaeaceae archaeon]